MIYLLCLSWFNIEGSYRVVHWRANAGLRLSYPATYNITCIILIQQHNTITIKGTRFKCSVREDYDLCESCQQKQTQPFPMVVIFHGCNSVCVSPCGKYIVSGSDDSMVRVWSLEDGALLRTLQGHTDWCRSVCVSPCGKYIVSGSDDNTVRVWGL